MEQRNEIVGATGQALTLRIDGRETAAPWSTVTGVSAGRVRLDRLSEQWVLVLAIEAKVEERDRLFEAWSKAPGGIVVGANWRRSPVRNSWRASV